jgi:S1-C subfamily serine protease
MRSAWKFAGLFIATLVVQPIVRGADDDASGPKQKTAATVVATPVDNSDPIANSVVKIFSKIRMPDPYRPWTKDTARAYTGTGVVIKGKKILTNAHMVLYASEVEIQANQSGDKIPAHVDFVASGIDLAVISLEDDKFFDTHPALQMSETLPQIKDAVTAYGYPEGGSGLSLTRGIVSRIEFVEYNPPISGLRIQIDAAINPGNSGGPAMVGDKMIGLAYSRLERAQNIGYIIPCEEIDLFLRDIADGHYDGKPAIYDGFQTLENPALRKFLKLDKSAEGLVVEQVNSKSDKYPLQRWDVISRIGDMPVDDQGMIKIQNNLRVKFGYWVQKIATNGKVPLTIWRDSKQVTVAVPVPTKYPQVIYNLDGAYPPYFIYGPMVFSPATKQYVYPMVDGQSSSSYVPWLIYDKSPLLTRYLDQPAFEGEELVVVTSPFFPHKVATGYSEPTMHVVREINSTRVKNLKHLVQLLRDCKDEFLTFKFEDTHAETLVFKHADMRVATDEVLADNGIRSQGTEELMVVWNGSSTKQAANH